PRLPNLHDKGRLNPGGHGTKKQPVLALVERNGRVRAMPIERVNAKTLHAAVLGNVTRTARVMTDEWCGYNGLERYFRKGHDTVNHSRKEYVRGDCYTNTVEGFFSILKRGINGVYHSVSKKHLHRYLAEFAYRYNTRHVDDGARTATAIRKGEGKRL